MRILASRKRDSVTGEEVVAVSHVVASAGGRFSNSLDNSDGVIILSVSDTALRKLGGLETGITAKRAVQKSTSRNRSRLVKGRKGTCKGRSSGKSSNFLATLLKDFCCSWSDTSGSVKKESNTWNSTSGGRGSVLKSEVKRKASVAGSCQSAATATASTEEEFPSSCSKPVTVVNSARDANSDTNEEVRDSNKDLLDTFRPYTAIIKNMRAGIYHEKQVKSLCALHALNNLIQDGNAFKQEDLDKICSELDPNSWVNPHKSVFGLGNYDINVIMTALQQKRLEVIWFDKRKDPSDELNFSNIYGFILNIPSDCKLGWLALPIKRKHWVAIRNLPSVTERDAGRNNYYNLDSKFDKPESIGTEDKLIEYLRSELKSPEKELFLVVIEEVGRLETWRKNPPPPPPSAETASTSRASVSMTHLPVPTGDSGCPDASAGSGNNGNDDRRTSNDSGVVDLLPDLRDINVVDLNREDLMRRQSSGVWSDLT